MIGIVIPCFNEENRLDTQAFSDFQVRYPHVCFCFVNDGSTDQTARVLQRLADTGRNRCLNLACNKGKAEAVRAGIRELLPDSNIKLLGYLDADLSTSLEELDQMRDLLEKDRTGLGIVCGSRVKRMGAEITRRAGRHYIGRLVATLIAQVLRMPFYDTQCGAKVFNRRVAETCFANPFVSRWLFDVELFLRMKKAFGPEEAARMVYEHPLRRWIHAEGSKIGVLEVFTTPLELLRIRWHYGR